MEFFQRQVGVETSGSGPIEITGQVAKVVEEAGLRRGLVHIFCRHTSCSLVLMENADPSAWRDLHRWMDRLVPADDPDFQHTLEGPDDMPSHIKMALTRSSETLPLMDGRLALGTWQGLFLWEHRRAAHRRELMISIQGTR